MDRTERFMERLRELEREYKEPLKGQAWVQSRIRWENWEGLRVKATTFAEQEIRRRKWRGARKGVLPGGVDAEDIADQVIEEMLSGKCRLVIGFTREKVEAELKRLVSQRVRVLHRLKEAGATRSEWEVLPPNEDGQRVSVLAPIVGEGPSSDEVIMEQEEQEQRKNLEKKVEEFLSREPELRDIFRCLCAGIKDPKEIGRKLGMEEKAVVAARARLERRLKGLRKARDGKH